MARSKNPRARKRLVEPKDRLPPPEGVPAWVGQAFGVALILGDFFLGRRLVESFDAFSDGGLSGIGDPFAWMFVLGLGGWWIVVLGWRWAAGPDRPVPMSAGAGVTALVIALATSVLAGEGLGHVLPALALDRGDGPNAVGIGVVTALFLALTALQWWRLQAGDPVPAPEDRDPAVRDPEEVPGGPRDPEGDPQADPGIQGPPVGRVPGRPVPRVPPVARLAAALLLLPAGWALMAPGDLLAIRAQAGIEMNWQGLLARAGVAAVASVFSAGVGMLLAYGPRVLASRILGEGQGALGFLGGLWLAHFVRLVLALWGT
ncbi:hypothetical protein KBD49_09870 [Myxococcota bacterium]|nr:hypothetical protein [Myxococcota bacterium]